MKHLELFSGYGTATFALKMLGVESKCVGYSDIDKYANQCFKQNHEGEELGDVTKINPQDLEDFDLLTGGFPCQAFSVAGKMQGELDPRGTLFYEIIRIAEHKQPKYMLLENVKGLTTKKFKDTFDKILSELDRIGYDVHWKVLNTKDHGIPQNRERVWFVCFRKDLRRTNFNFPEQEELKLLLKNFLKEKVDSKYLLKENQVNKLLLAIEQKKMQSRRMENINSYSGTMLSRDYKDPKVIQWDTSGKGYNSQQDRAYSVDGVMSCLPNANPSNKINIFAINPYNLKMSSTETGTIGQSVGTTTGKTAQLISSTLTTELAHSTGRDFFRSGQAESIKSSSGIFRRLTPRECFRLQGFLNDEINLEGLSDTQRYKLAGNGQSVNVVMKLFKRMLKK